MKILGIVPARAGSKGIPRKNLQLLDGEPLLARALITAVKSYVLDKIIFSSDDDEMIKIANECDGVEIPFKRPSVLALDDTPIVAVISHLLEWLKLHYQYIPDAFMLLEPTCPLRTVQDIQRAVALFIESNKPCLFSVAPPIQHPSDFIYQMEAGNWSYCLARSNDTRGRQDFKKAWFINGAIYLTRTDFFLETKKIYDLDLSEIYYMGMEGVFDVDTPFDLELVQAYVDRVNFFKTENTSCQNS